VEALREAMTYLSEGRVRRDKAAVSWDDSAVVWDDLQTWEAQWDVTLSDKPEVQSSG